MMDAPESRIASEDREHAHAKAGSPPINWRATALSHQPARADSPAIATAPHNNHNAMIPVPTFIQAWIRCAHRCVDECKPAANVKTQKM